MNCGNILDCFGAELALHGLVDQGTLAGMGGIGRFLAWFQRGNNSLQMPITLHPPNLGRQGLSLRRLQPRVTQPARLGLDGAITCSSDGSTGQLSQTGQIVGQFFDDNWLYLGPAFSIRFGFCCLILLSHSLQVLP